MKKIKKVNIWLKSDDFRFYCPFTGLDLFNEDGKIIDKIFDDQIVVKNLLYCGMPDLGDAEWISPKYREAFTKYMEEASTRSDDSIFGCNIQSFLSDYDSIEELLVFYLNDDVPAPACLGPWVLIYQTGC